LNHDDALDVVFDFHRYYLGIALDDPFFGKFVNLISTGTQKEYNSFLVRRSLASLNAAYTYKNKEDVFSPPISKYLPNLAFLSIGKTKIPILRLVPRKFGLCS
jgi:hypothetical protein